MRVGLVALLWLPLAGCLSSAPLADDGTIGAGGAAMQRPDIVPPARTIEQVVLLHEEPTATGQPDWLTLTNERPPRDVELSFAGTHLAFDEWGRAIPAMVFQYTSMDIVIDEVDLVGTEIQATGHWQEVPREFYFDLADGRFLGQTNLDMQARGFRDPVFRDPLTWSDPLSFLFMAVHVLGGDMSGTIASYEGHYAFEPDPDERPLPGRCAVYRVVWVPDDPPAPEDVVDEVEGQEGGAWTCVDGQTVPLWTYVGRGDGPAGGGSYSVERRSGSLQPPPLQGDPLPVREFPRHPWDPVQRLPLLPPILAPYSVDGRDWSGDLQARLEALQLNPFFLEYYLTHPDLYLNNAMTGWPNLGATLVDLLLGVTAAPFSFEEESWLWTTPGEGFYWGFVDTDPADDAEDEDRHVSTRNGADFDFAEWQFPTAGELPDLVSTGQLVGEYASFSPDRPRVLHFNVWPEFEDIDWGDGQYTWWAMDECFAAAEADETPFYLSMSAVSGRLWSAGVVQTREDGCTAGGAFLELPGGEVLRVPGPGDVMEGFLWNPRSGPIRIR